MGTAKDISRAMRETFDEGLSLGQSQGFTAGMEAALGLRPMTPEQERCLRGLHARRRTQGQARAYSALLGLTGVLAVAAFSVWSLFG